MKKTIIAALVALTGCVSVETKVENVRTKGNPYQKTPFYAQFLNTGSSVDREITKRLTALRKDPQNAQLHTELGALLFEKGFPKDAEREFRRALAVDPKMYAAWYNIGLVRESRGDYRGAERAYRNTLAIKSGHAAALFNLALLEEKHGKDDDAVEHYAKAFHFNSSLLDVRVNPRILDSNLVDRALLVNYSHEHARTTTDLEERPRTAGDLRKVPQTPQAPSKQPRPEEIVPPSPSLPKPAMQPPGAGTVPVPVPPPSRLGAPGHHDTTVTPAPVPLRPNATSAARLP